MNQPNRDDLAIRMYHLRICASFIMITLIGFYVSFFTCWSIEKLKKYLVNGLLGVLLKIWIFSQN